MAKKPKDKPQWPGWFYGPDGAAAIFQCREDVPAGWEDHPSKVKAVDTFRAMEVTGSTEVVCLEPKAPAKPPVKAKRPYRRRKVA